MTTSSVPTSKATTSSSSAVSVSWWNPLSSIRSLFIAPVRPAGFAGLDGFRAFLTLWMVFYHSFAYVAAYYTYDDVLQVGKEWILTPMLIGPYAVDGFFVLTGFLLTYPLLNKHKPASAVGAHKKDDNMKNTSNDANGDGAAPLSSPSPQSSFDVRDWYYRRITRMAPFYLIVIFYYCKIAAPNGRYEYKEVKSEFDWLMKKIFSVTDEWVNNRCDVSWASALFINNVIPGAGCLIHTWSLCVQFQFYLWLPLLYKKFGAGAWFAYTCVIGIIVSTIVRYIAFWHQAIMDNQADAMITNFIWYSSTITRMNVLLMGSLSAWLATQTSFISWLHTHRLARQIPKLLGAMVFIGAAYWSTWFSDGRLLTAPGDVAGQYANHGWWHCVYWVLFMVGAPASSVAYTYVILAIVYRIGTFGRVMSTILSSKLWYPVAQLGFAIYLLHPIVYDRYMRSIWILPSPLTADNVIIYSFVSLLTVLIISMTFYVCIERPLEQWLRYYGDHITCVKRTVHIYSIILIVSGVTATVGSLFWLLHEPDATRTAQCAQFNLDFPALAPPPTLIS